MGRKKRVIEGYEGFDRAYWDAKADEAYNKVDWGIMNKHLDSDHARQLYESFRKNARRHFDCIPNIVFHSKAPNLAYYHRKMYSSPGSMSSTNVTGQKHLCRITANARRMPIIANYLMAFTLGAASFGLVLAWREIGSANATIKKESVSAN